MEESFFTFQPIDLAIVLATGLVLVVGLALFALRRRNEILRTYLTSDEEDIEEQFFRARPKKPVVEDSEPEITEEELPADEISNEWGTPSDVTHEHGV